MYICQFYIEVFFDLIAIMTEIHIWDYEMESVQSQYDFSNALYFLNIGL